MYLAFFFLCSKKKNKTPDQWLTWIGNVVLSSLVCYFLFQLSGLALIIIGAVIKLKYDDYMIHLSDSSLTTGPVFLVVIGVIVFIIGFLGCCGAYKENYCMVTTVSTYKLEVP